MSGPQPGTPTPWEVDTIQSEGEYGNGPFTHSGFSVSAIYDAQGRVIFDALNSDVIEVHEDYGDEDGFVSAYDATSAANAAAIVHRMNNWDALVAERDALQARVDALADVSDTLGEALFHLSDKLRGSGFLSDNANYAEYERVVAAFQALTKARGQS